MRTVIASMIAVPLAFAAWPAAAQSNPTAAQIIQSLKPSGNLTSGQTRGIRLVAPNPSPATPAVAQEPSSTHNPPAPVHEAAVSHAAPAAPSVNLTVDFASGSAALTPEARKTLDQLGQALSSHDLASYRFRIEGHTDTVGSAAYNQKLSQQRAEAVAAYLEHTYSIHPSRLEAVGMGEKGLLVPTPPQTPNAKNRRVEVINLGA